ncbi:beta-phosphoglucomutase family hydrolase (plasmid) [Deinococcus metallilatus]|uniref:Beta-phosphoglucomutase n=1 Tax=Deinococcus metallilatus TaxID=1211322 RepID=A0AAJ5JZS6_9DEIO|nr:beta-phosphoglucomutase family hydrolase [Deinococcus metallilatus]MBB5293259.1 beta-phosphoglucomutase [Deinococcus metallilatus]QBY07042.1 beta-phosphoglucomutase family hydrolase [Deinococcus metallilatus]RXJ18053.1 beta-phosphoglucomutase family hydrolase [Deinococcus metallilatus]TLK31989.1 beta-phosphoglucomutase family hydrolase [Deinococcus metallilatus]
MNLGFIFDLDGVLTDTVELHYHSWQRLAEEEGVPFSREANAALLGRTREDALDLWLNGRPCSPEQRADLLWRKNASFLEALEGLGPGDLLPGVAELLHEARERGVRLGLASSSRNARRVCDRLGVTALFGAFADGSSVVNPKPAPDIFLWVAGRLGLHPTRCLVFEDSEAGVRAALAGGFPVVGLGDPARVGHATWVRPDLNGATVEEFARHLDPLPALS